MLSVLKELITKYSPWSVLKLKAATLLEGWCVCQNFRKDSLESKRPMLMDLITESENFYSFGPSSELALIKKTLRQFTD